MRVRASTNDCFETPLEDRRTTAGGLTPAEPELLERSERPGPGQIAAAALATGTELRVQERRIRPGDAIVVIGEVRRGADGQLELVGGAKKPLLVGGERAPTRHSSSADAFEGTPTRPR